MLLKNMKWKFNRPIVEHITIGSGGLGSIPGSVKSDTVSPTARHRYDVSSELCCPGAKPHRWTSSLVTCVGVILRV